MAFAVSNFQKRLDDCFPFDADPNPGTRGVSVVYHLRRYDCSVVFDGHRVELKTFVYFFELIRNFGLRFLAMANLKRVMRLPLHVLCFVLSLLSLIWAKCSSTITKLHSFPVRQNYRKFRDSRSDKRRTLLQGNVLNVVHVSNPVHFLTNYFSIFPAISYRHFFRSTYAGRTGYIGLGKGYHFNPFLSRVLGGIKCDEFHVLDDPRNWCLFLEIAERNGMVSKAYMHARFNEHHIPLFEMAPNNYEVWTRYFEVLYRQKHKAKTLVTTFTLSSDSFPQKLPDLNITAKKHDKIKILLVDDDTYSLEKLLQETDPKLIAEAEVHVRSKYGFSHKPENQFTVSPLNVGFRDYLDQEGIHIVIGGISTCLIEAPFFGAIGATAVQDKGYGAHLLRDNLVAPVAALDQLLTSLKQREAYLNMLRNTHRLDRTGQ